MLISLAATWQHKIASCVAEILASFYLKLLKYFMNNDIQNKQENEPNKFHVNFLDSSRNYVPDGRPEHGGVSG